MAERTDKAPRERPGVKTAFEKKGLILVFTGDGKGKTTAALGIAFRALGHGLKTAMVQFIKGDWESGELEAARRVGGALTIFPMGEGFTWDTKNFEKDVECAKRAWEKCKDLLHDNVHDIVIFDEIHCAAAYNFLDPAEVAGELKKCPPFKHVILTGRSAPQEIVEIADLVSDIRCVKHPFQRGIQAQPGIDY